MPKPGIVRDIEFAKRLERALDQHDAAPSGHGRQRWLATKMEVSDETIRKWMNGEARPNRSRMRDLAKLLRQDEGWLALGIKPGVDDKKRAARNALADGAVNIVTGLIQIDGGHPAFPEEGDPEFGYADVFAIIRGKRCVFHVAAGISDDSDILKFYIPLEWERCTVLGFMRRDGLKISILNLSPILPGVHLESRGDFFELEVQRQGRFYTAEGKRIKEILDFSTPPT